MSFSCGFYNSIDHDRVYDARQFSSIYDGVINDGIFSNIGDCFVVTAQSELTVLVGSGRAWFNHSWSLNDAAMPLEMPLSTIGLNRIDAIVLEVNESDAVRDNAIKVIQGTPAATPERPVLIDDELVHQHPLCYIYRPSSSSIIYQANITNMVGTDDCPFVTGILQVVSLDKLLGQWRSELDLFVQGEEEEFRIWSQNKRIEFENWAAFNKEAYETFISENEEAFTEWMNGSKEGFSEWMDELETELSGDVAGNLLLKIDKEEVNRVLQSGFSDGVKEFSDDGSVIITTASDGRKMTKTFSDGFSKLTTVVQSAAGRILATQIKVFDSSGKLITTTTTYN